MITVIARQTFDDWQSDPNWPAFNGLLANAVHWAEYRIFSVVDDVTEVNANHDREP